MRYAYHLGVHKTASTFIQSALQLNHERLRERGVFVVQLEMPEVIQRQKHVLRRIENGRRVAANALEETNEKIERAAERAGASVVLLSDENRLGQPAYTRLRATGQATFYGNAEACLNHITHGQPDDQTSIVVYTRRHARLIPSLYAEGLRRLAIDLDLNGFCAALDWSGFRFSHVLRQIQSACPKARLAFRPMEQITDGAAGFLADFFDLLRIDGSGLTLPTAPVRPSPDADQARKLRDLAERRFAGDEIAPLRRAARRILRDNHPGKHPLQLSGDHLQRARSIEADDIFSYP